MENHSKHYMFAIKKQKDKGKERERETERRIKRQKESSGMGGRKHYCVPGELNGADEK